MQDFTPPVSPVQLVRLVAANIACAPIVGLCVALPVTGATFLVAVDASCLTTHGCDTPTFVDALVPVVALTTWGGTAIFVGVHQIRLLLAAVLSWPMSALRRHSSKIGLR